MIIKWFCNAETHLLRSFLLTRYLIFDIETAISKIAAITAETKG
jgi:hypothetical protein